MYKVIVFLFMAVTVAKSLSLNAKLGAKEDCDCESSTIAGEEGQNNTDSTVTTSPSTVTTSSTTVTTNPSTTNTTEDGQSTPSLFQKWICIAKCPLTGNKRPVCGSDGNTYANIGFFECVKSCGVKVNLNATSPCPIPTTKPLLTLL